MFKVSLHVFRDRSCKCCYYNARPVGYQKHSVIYIWRLFLDYFSGRVKWTIKLKQRLVQSQKKKTILPTEYEHNSSLRVDLLDTFADLDDNIWLFNYRVSSTKIELGAFLFVVIICGTSPAAHYSGKSPKHVKMAQLSLPSLRL